MIRTRVREVRSQEFGTTGGGGVGLGCGGPRRSRVEGNEGHGRCRGCAAVGGKGGERARNDDESTGEGVGAGGVAREDVGEGEVTCDSITRREGLAGRRRRAGGAGRGVGGGKDEPRRPPCARMGGVRGRPCWRRTDRVGEKWRRGRGPVRPARGGRQTACRRRREQRRRLQWRLGWGRNLNLADTMLE
jgi:hypothetical protein